MGIATIVSKFPASGGGGGGALALAFNGANGYVNIGYTGALIATGGSGGYVYSYTGTKPTWATINSATGAITGTPNAVASTTFTGVVTDSASNTATVSVTINVFSGTGGGPTGA